MRLTVRLALVLLFALPGAVGAQSSLPANVGDNANILPIYKSDRPLPNDDYLRGNLLGQRCNEPSIGISSINRDHMMVFCNDYRATYNFDDSLVPSGKTTLVASAWNGVKTFMAWVTGRPGPQPKAPRIIASAEAGIGGGVSYDGGTTWQGFMVPGGPNDSSPASLAHPGKALNLQGYSDPWAMSMKDGRVGVAYIGFTRDKVTGQSTQSGIFFTRYRDLNASDVAHDWQYEFSSQVALSNNLTQGQFLDKVSGTVGPTGILYVAYTRFTGSSGSSSIFLAQSTDGGRIWSTVAIDKDSKYGQGTVAVVHPTDAAAVGVLWRTFVNSSLVFKSTAKGAKNVDLFADRPGRSLQGLRPVLAGDQHRPEPGRLPHAGLPVGRLHARRLQAHRGVPRVDRPEHRQAGHDGAPHADGRDEGLDGQGRDLVGALRAQLDERRAGPRCPPRPSGWGSSARARPVGAQLMPTVACTVGNQCMVVWKQSFDATLTPGGTENLGLVRDRRPQPPVRRARGPGDVLGHALPRPSTSFQVSRYGYREFGPTETPSDVRDTDDWVAKMELPNGTSYPMFDWGNRNHSGAGRVAFGGDYIGVKEVAAPGTSPTFMVAFSDNRYNIWPWQTETGGLVPPGQEWRYYPVFMAPDDPESIVPGVSCVNYGSRVQSVMTAKVSASALQLSAPTNRKPFAGALPACGGPAGTRCIEFPLNVRNNTASEREVTLTLPVRLVRKATVRCDARCRQRVLRLPAPDG